MKTVSNLFIGGLVERELELGPDDLAGAPAIHQVADVGELVEGREGTAVRFVALAELAGWKPEARYVHVESADGGFTANLPVEQALEGGLVLYALNQEGLPARFGGPYRLLFPDSEDCSVSVKFLSRVEFLAEPGSHTARCPT